jgi:RNA polymerase sigma-70 factor (ECF subfamily)
VTTIDAEASADPIDRLAPYQGELARHAARMLGSHFEADDAVQDTMVRAWRGLDRFEGRSHLRSWLYRICTNVCRDMLASPQRRPQPALGASPDEAGIGAPAHVAAAVASGGDPADIVEARESVWAALAVLQRLPPRQRAVLILREVLHWRAAEIADLLDTSVAGVNSALQRARATLALHDMGRSLEVDHESRRRLHRYARALGSTDIDALVALVAREAA